MMCNLAPGRRALRLPCGRPAGRRASEFDRHANSCCAAPNVGRPAASLRAHKLAVAAAAAVAAAVDGGDLGRRHRLSAMVRNLIRQRHYKRAPPPRWTGELSERQPGGCATQGERRHSRAPPSGRAHKEALATLAADGQARRLVCGPTHAARPFAWATPAAGDKLARQINEAKLSQIKSNSSAWFARSLVRCLVAAVSLASRRGRGRFARSLTFAELLASAGAARSRLRRAKVSSAKVRD